MPQFPRRRVARYAREARTAISDDGGKFPGAGKFSFRCRDRPDLSISDRDLDRFSRRGEQGTGRTRTGNVQRRAGSSCSASPRLFASQRARSMQRDCGGFSGVQAGGPFRDDDGAGSRTAGSGSRPVALGGHQMPLLWFSVRREAWRGRRTAFAGRARVEQFGRERGGHPLRLRRGGIEGAGEDRDTVNLFGELCL